MTRIVCCLAIFASLWTAGVTHATSYHVVADQVLADQADVVLHGRVIDRAVTTRAGRVVTIYTVLPVDVVKGWANPHGISVEVLGGQMPDGRFLHLFGAPSFELNQDVLFFLRHNDGAPLRILHVMQGAFLAIENGGEYAWFRTLDEGATLPKAGGGLPVSSVRDADRFVDWLRDRAVGAHRTPDYVEPLATDGAVAVSKFTLLGGDDNPPFLRWFTFNEGGRVQWRRHSAGQPGSTDRGASAFAAARAAWNSEPNTPVRYRDGGTTSSRNGFGNLDGQTTILFRDLNDDIDTDYNCSQGGTLAIGGVHGVASLTPQTWRGRAFLETTEAEIVVNTGASCFADNNRDLEELYTHELGHTLGLGHSCGDDNSPSCVNNPDLSRAVMRANFPLASRGAVLRNDDIAGLRFLYEDGDGGGGGGTCSLAAGSGRFCTVCGPCSEGEGDCDTDAECGTGLVCRDNIGAQFGFAPGVDVCVASGGGGGGGGGGGECSLNSGHPQLCSDPACGPCGFGEGDCDNDAECAGNLTCEDNVGADFGFAPGIDVCLGACSEILGSGQYCTACGPCGVGQGDCDRDAECAAGLTCVDNVGANFGFAPGVDVCM